MAIIYKDNTYRITASFTSWDDDTNTSSVEDPTVINVTNYSGESIDPGNIVTGPTVPTLVVPGEYYYDYTPATLGSFLIVFDASFVGSDDEQIIYEFDVVSDGSSSSLSAAFETLIEDQTLLFSSGLDPLYVAPEELIDIFPEAGLLETAEYIHHASLEVLDILITDTTETTVDELPYVAFEYIKASAACALSKIYDDGGQNFSIRLGDMSVTNPNAGGSARYINRANATSWCQLAAALRNELFDDSILFAGSASRTFSKSISHANPMPDRTVLYPGEVRQDLDELRTNRGLRSLND